MKDRRDRIEESVHDFVSTHECIITNKLYQRGDNIDVKFTRWGNNVARRCLIVVVKLRNHSNLT
jgi:hypothetical protein